MSNSFEDDFSQLSLQGDVQLNAGDGFVSLPKCPLASAPLATDEPTTPDIMPHEGIGKEEEDVNRSQQSCILSSLPSAVEEMPPAEQVHDFNPTDSDLSVLGDDLMSGTEETLPDAPFEFPQFDEAGKRFEENKVVIAEEAINNPLQKTDADQNLEDEDLKMSEEPTGFDAQKIMQSDEPLLASAGVMNPTPQNCALKEEEMSLDASEAAAIELTGKCEGLVKSIENSSETLAVDITVEAGNQSQTNTPSKSTVQKIKPSITEPENMIQWRKDHAKMIEERDLAECERKEQWKDSAMKELEIWEKNYQAVIEKTKICNKEANAAFLADQSEEKNKIGFLTHVSLAKAEPVKKDSGEASEWDYITKLCDFNKTSKSIRGDVSRMRSVLLSLKKENDVVPQVTKRPSRKEAEVNTENDS